MRLRFSIAALLIATTYFAVLFAVDRYSPSASAVMWIGAWLFAFVTLCRMIASRRD